MTDLIAELAEVVRLDELATPGAIELHTSCSWRRIVAPSFPNDRPFLVPGIEHDGHPNMDKTENAEFVVALVNWFRTHHATLARVIESEAEIRADYEALVIRLGEVTTELEGAHAVLRECVENREGLAYEAELLARINAATRTTR